VSGNATLGISPKGLLALVSNYALMLLILIIMRIQRNITEPKRQTTDYDVLWNGEDQGLITSWETGRDKAKSDPGLATRAKNGELVMLGWKGGVEKVLKTKNKYGGLLYVAMWQGLRGENLDIDLSSEIKMTCSRTGVPVTYTSNIKLLCSSEGLDD
jgi:hypothetical protein